MFCWLYLLGILLNCNASLTLNPECLWLQKDSTTCLLWMYKAVLKDFKDEETEGLRWWVPCP